MHKIAGPMFFVSIMEGPHLLRCDAASPDYNFFNTSELAQQQRIASQQTWICNYSAVNSDPIL
jgi:hypothetical protein